MRFADLTFREIAAAASRGAIAVVPTGCTEQQGPHLPVSFDTWFADELTNAAAERVLTDGIEALVLPALPFGPTPEHRNFGSGFVDMSRELHDKFVASILGSLADQGFRSILVWRGCGGHDLRSVVTDFNEARDGSPRAFLPGHPFHAIWCAIGDADVAGGHADSFATSIALFRHPDQVRMDEIPREPSDTPQWSDPDLDFARYSTTGVVGDATHASAELGARLWKASVDAVADILRRIANAPETVGIESTMQAD